MLINSVEKYKGQTYEVILQNDRHIYLNHDIIVDHNIKNGMNISDEQLDKILHSSDVRRARERALYLLDMRDYSYVELFDKLEKNYSEDICYEVLNTLAELGMINDRNYAESLAYRYVEVKKYGAYRARMEMKRRGIDNDIIDEVLENYEDDTQERIMDVICSKYQQYLTNSDDRKSVEKVKSALVRMGYGYRDINDVVREYFEQTEDNDL